MKKSRLFALNAAIMTSTSLLLSSVGVWFNLYLSNRLGAVGMGIFQLMASVSTLALTLACSGIGLASTRMVAEELVRPQGNIRRTMRRCLLHGLFFGTLSCLILWKFAPIIGSRLLGAVETIRPLRAMALSLPFIACSCSMNGYFTAMRHVAKSSLVQMIEQFLRLGLTIYALELLIPNGDLERACLAVALSGMVSEGCACLTAWILYRLDSRNCPRGSATGQTRKLLGISLPVAFSTYLRQGLSTIKHLLIPVRLQAGGLSAPVSVAVFGAVQGVALPVLLFPYAFFDAFNLLIIPELAQAHTKGQRSAPLVEKMLSLTLTCSMIVCGVLFYFSHEIGDLVSDHPDVGVYIRLLAPIVPVMYLDTAVDSMLKGLDQQVYVMRCNVIDAFFSMASVWVLLPILGIKGYILIICASELFNFSLSVSKLWETTHFYLDLSFQVVRPFLCAAISVVVAGLFQKILPGGNPGTICLMALSGLFYALLIRLSTSSSYQSLGKL